MSAPIALVKPKIMRSRLTFIMALLIVAAVMLASFVSPSMARADELPASEEAAPVVAVEEAVVAPSAEAAPPAAPAAPEPAAPEPAPAPAPEPAPAPAAPETPAEPAGDTSGDGSADAGTVEVAPVAQTVEVQADSAASDESAADTSSTDEVAVPAINPAFQRGIYQSADCVIGLLATTEPANVAGAVWTLVDIDGNPIAGFGAPAVTANVTYTFGVQEAGFYEAAMLYPDGSGLYVGARDITCNVPLGQTYVQVSNESAIGNAPLSGLVEFDVAFYSDATTSAYVDIVILPAVGDVPVADRTITVTGAGSVSEQFTLPVGNYRAEIYGGANCGGDCLGYALLTDAPLPFTVTDEDPAGPVEIDAPPLVAVGNLLPIPTREGVEYYNVDTGEVLTGTVVIPVGGITGGARSTDEESFVVKGGPWANEYLPENRTEISFGEVGFDCSSDELVWVKPKFETEIAYVRLANGTVEERRGPTKFVGLVPVEEDEIPEDAQGSCPLPENPDNGGPGTGTPGDGAGNGNTGGNAGGSGAGTASGSKAPGSVKSLAATGGSGVLDLLWSGIALLAAGGLVSLLRRRNTATQ